MGRLAAIARTGLAAVLLHPLRSLATGGCLVAVLLPYVAGMGVARGLLDEAHASIRFGADLYVSGTRFGRPSPLPIEVAGTLRAIAGVRDVCPRIVGEITLGAERVSAVVVGLPAERLPAAAGAIEGRLFRGGRSHELVMGSELARRLHLSVGSRLPPFYRNEAGERVSTVVGLFRDDLPPWQANLVFCSIETAAEIFDQQGLVTSLLVECEPGYRRAVARAVQQLPAPPRDAHGAIIPVVTSAEDLELRLGEGPRHLAGIFQLHFVLAFAVGIPLLAVTSGVGLSERRREAAILKATGWMTDELLLRAAVESLVLCVLGASTAVLLAYAWLVPLNGQGIVGIFLPGAEASPSFRVPFRLVPVPALLAFVVSFAIVATGTLYSTWRAATAAPALALR
jgi:ABC-type lipoprotein release transport system permease subunit